MASLLDDPNFMMTMGLGLLQSAQKGPRQNVGANLLSSLQQYAQGDAQRRSTAIAESENARRQAAQEQADRERQRASLLQQDFVTNAIGQKGGAFDAQLFPGEAPIPGLLNEPKGIVGGMLSPQEFYAKAAGVPGMESEGMRGLGGLLEAQAKRDNPTFGNAPVWGFDANGNAVALQTSSAGGQLTPAIAPPGVQLAVPQTYKDFGGGIVALPSRAIPGAQPNVAKTLPPEKLPENIAAAASAETKAKMTAESEGKRIANTFGITALVNSARDIMFGKEGAMPTQSGIGTAIDKAAALVGRTPSGASQADKLKVIGGALVGKVPRFEGPQSDADRKLYIEMAGQIGDSTIPIERRLAALKAVEDMWGKYDTETGAPLKTAPQSPSGWSIQKVK